MFRLAYDDPADRAEFIRRLVAGARPNYGHYVMAALMAVDRLRVVFTTNFDDLPEQAARSLLDSPLVSPRRPLVTADLGDPAGAARALTRVLAGNLTYRSPAAIAPTDTPLTAGQSA